MAEKIQKGFPARRKILLLLLLLALSFGLRLHFLQARGIIDSDGVYYTMLGINLFSGKGYTEPEGIYQWYYPPFFPINIGLAGLLTNHRELAAETVSLLYGSLLPLAIVFITTLIYNFQIAIFAGFLSAVFPPFVQFSSSATAESIFLFYTVLLACLGYYLISRTTSWFFALGLTAGILYLIKPAGIQYLGVASLFLILGSWFWKWSRATILKGAIALVLGWAFLSVPYLIYLHNHHGYWTLSELSTRNLYRSVLLANNDNKEKEYQLTDDKKNLLYFTSSSHLGKHLGLSDVFKHDPVSFVYRYFRNFLIQVKRTLTYGRLWMSASLFMPILLFGILTTWREREGVYKVLFLACMLFPFLTYPLVSSEARRWLLPFVAILNIWFAKGIFELQSLSRLSRIFFLNESKLKSFIKNYGVYFLIILLIGFETSNVLSHSIKLQKYYYPLEHKDLGLFMKAKKVSCDSIIMSISPHVAFYAQTRLKTIPWGEYSNIIAYAKHHGVDYLVIDETYVPRRRPQLAFLLDEKRAPSELELFSRLEGSNGKKILVYRFRKLNPSH